MQGVATGVSITVATGPPRNIAAAGHSRQRAATVAQPTSAGHGLVSIPCGQGIETKFVIKNLKNTPT